MVVDESGFRLNVAIVLVNDQGQVFWGKRIGTSNAWQFPQGGLMEEETPEQAMFRELEEELGLTRDHVTLLAESQRWLHYYLPKHLRRLHSLPLVVGQRQKWFLLRLKAEESNIRFDTTSKPEFETWQWVDYWHPTQQVILFKRQVYRMALKEFFPLVFPQ